MNEIIVKLKSQIFFIERVKMSASAAADVSNLSKSEKNSKQLSKALKKMNQDLNHLIDYIKDIDLKKK